MLAQLSNNSSTTGCFTVAFRVCLGGGNAGSRSPVTLAFYVDVGASKYDKAGDTIQGLCGWGDVELTVMIP